MTTAEEQVLERTIDTACGRYFGVITLNAPVTLNALSLPIFRRMTGILHRFRDDPRAVGVIIDSSSDKAFCAGGDVVSLYHAIQENGAGKVPPLAYQLFENEYRMDYMIHTYPKPVLCWGHGVVMGGGVGIMCGASHRVATPGTRMAMPEITIGLFPDVAGSWFLPRMPGKTGLFLALTGSLMNAADACFSGMADYVIDHAGKASVLESIAATGWADPVQARCQNDVQLTVLLQALCAAPGSYPASMLREHFDTINSVIGQDGLEAIAPRLGALRGHPDVWLARAGTTFAQGSPWSAVLAYTMQQVAARLSLAEVFRLEYLVATASAGTRDFPEGVRALLVEKDKKPRWQHQSVTDVTLGDIAAMMQAPAGSHPLADLQEPPAMQRLRH